MRLGTTILMGTGVEKIVKRRITQSKKTKIRFAFLESFQILYKLYGREINKKHSKNDQNEVLENLPPLPYEIKCSAS